MSTALIVEILLGVLACIVGVVTFLAASNANRQQARATMTAVDAAAYQRAQQIYESALASLRIDLENMRDESQRLRESNDRLRAEVTELRLEIGRLRLGLHDGAG